MGWVSLPGVASVALLLTLTARGVAAQTCVGDCTGNGNVSIDDLIRGVNIALGKQPLSSCTALDRNNNGEVSVAELVQAVGAALDGCPQASTPTPITPDTPTPSPQPSPSLTRSPGPLPFCELPGSLQTTAAGIAVVPGGPATAPDLSFIHLPIGFCVHHFATVGNTRQLRFSPSGDLFVASPTRFTTSDGGNATFGRLPGRAAIVVLPDDDHDGTADVVQTYLGDKSETVGMLFHDGYLYYQDGTTIMRIPHALGDRIANGASEEVADITAYASPLHWPKALDADDNGTIYVTNGADEETPVPCNLTTQPFKGGILKLDGAPGGTIVARGFRNPISLRCVRGRNLCFAIELTRDNSTPNGGREKLLPIRQGDHWGFPCCATRDRPYDDLPGPDCSNVAAEIDSFFVGNTPFDLDYEVGRWPDPWGDRAYVALHGGYGSWAGARMVGIGLDAMTGQVLPGSDLPGLPSGAMVDFASGWVDNPSPPVGFGRPTVVAFAPDGRLFLGNDTTGDIIWFAPLDLAPPP